MTRRPLVTTAHVIVAIALLACSENAFAQKKVAAPTGYAIIDSSTPPLQIGVAVALVPTTKILTTFMEEDVVLSVNRNGIVVGGEPLYVLGSNCQGDVAVWVDLDSAAFARELSSGPNYAWVPGDQVPFFLYIGATWSRMSSDGVCENAVAPPTPDVFYARRVPLEFNWTLPLKLVRK